MITIKGVLTRITFQNPDNHYTVCRVQVDKISEPITVVGHIAGVGQGQVLTLGGKWVSHPRYGDQFEAQTYGVTLPGTVQDIRNYLGSGMLKGIRKTLVDLIVDTFQEQTLEIIENEPDKLQTITGIGKARQQLIENSWNRLHSVRRVMQFLQDKGVGITHAGTILKTYGTDALRVLETDPYRIAMDIIGITFQTVDAIARAAGVPKEDGARLKACVICQLLLYEQEGHVYAPKTDLLAACARTSGVAVELFEEPLQALLETFEVVLEEPEAERESDELNPCEKLSAPRIYLERLFKAESRIASRIKALLSLPPSPPRISEDQILEEVLTKRAVKLSCEQLEVVWNVLHQKIVVITGGPGTGKTTLVQALCAVFRRLNLTVALSAPTGRAARRLTQVTGKKAFTLHKLLGFDPESQGFDKSFTNPLDLDVFVVDEASMVDTQLMYHLVEAMPARGSLILVGDTFQLPSVGPGNVLSDIISSSRVEVFPLTKIFRQAQESPIVLHAHSIRNGVMPDFKAACPGTLSEFYFIENSHPRKVVETILELCSKRIPQAFPHIDEIQVLTPMHRGEAGTINLNQQLQAVLNPCPDGIESRGFTYKPGDKVMHLKNNYEKEVFNGDIGVVQEVLKSEGKLMVDYDGRIVTYELVELDELALAYAVSVHKSQGSEYGAVIIALTMAHFPMLQRNLLYTAMTRGKHLVIIVGGSRALETAFQNNKTVLRLSGLREKLMAD